MPGEEMDHMDDLIREASNSHHPVYDDKAWEKMEALLNEHLPVKKERRRPAIIAVLLLLFVAAGSLVLFYPLAGKRQLRNQTVQPSLISGKNAAEKARRNGDKGSAGIGQPTGPLQTPVTSKAMDPKKTGLPVPAHSGVIGPIHLAGSVTTTRGTDENVSQESNQDQRSPLTLPSIPNQNTDLAEMPGLGLSLLRISQASLLRSANVKQEAARVNIQKIVVADSLQAAAASVLKPSGRQTLAAKFGLTATIAPDRSFIQASQPGSTIINYGIGLSYRLSGRFTLSTGFYAAQKVYSAPGKAYRPPKSYWTYNVDLRKVNADCKIYEIPVAVSYSFGNRRKHHWLATAGVSSFLMKKEVYNYEFIDTAGQARNRTWTLRNGRDNFLSVISLSAGYEYRLMPSASIIIQPYLKLPLTGIGFGKINLSSMGVAFTGTFKPFGNRN